MKLTPNRAGANRDGFTLLELLVIIAIIAVVASLLLAGVMNALGYQTRNQNHYDLRQLADACEQFKLKYGMYPPTRSIVLSNDPAVYQTTAPGRASWSVLQRIWPKLDINKSYDWARGRMGAKKYSVVLEGHECLVFFLGGMQVESPGLGCIGFGAGDHDPTDLRGSKRVKPFYDFKGARLVKRSSSHPFFSYLDIYKEQPFAYFRASGGRLGAYSADCPSLNVKPYFHCWDNKSQRYVDCNDKTPGLIVVQKFYNPESFQIISAGSDGRFGPGGEYDINGPKVPLNGNDDMANFHNGLLGAPN